MVRRLATGLLLLLGATGVHADRVWLNNGNYLEGSAVVLPDGQVEIRSSLGTVTLPAETVARVERAETVEAEVKRALTVIPPGDAEAVYELALWCESRGAHTLARRLLREVLARDSDHESAREALGYRRLDERWVTEDEWHELRGEVHFRGEWMSREERARLLELATLQAQADVERQRERARLAQLRYEAALVRQPTGVPINGIPYLPWGFGSGTLVVPGAFIPPLKTLPHPATSPGPGQPSRHRAAPTARRPAPAPPQHNHGRFAVPRR